MKAKDIRPAIIYGHKRGRYDSVKPVVLLAAPGPDILYSAAHPRRDGEPYFEHRPYAGKPHRSVGFSVGWPAVTTRSDGDGTDGLLAATLDEFRTTTSRDNAGGGYAFMLVVNPAEIRGEYEAVLAQDKADRQARDDHYQREWAARDAARARTEGLIAQLAEHGVSAAIDGHVASGRVTIALPDVEKLLGLLASVDRG